MNYQRRTRGVSSDHPDRVRPKLAGTYRLHRTLHKEPHVAKSGHIRMHDGFEAEWPGSRSLATEIVLNVVRTGMTLHARVDAIVREYGLPSATSLGVLEVLRAEGSALQPSAIAQRLLSSRPALSGVLDTLQRRGFVRRQAHPDSGRGRLVEITPSGIEVIERLLPALHRTEVSWMAGLSEPEQEQLIGYLGRLQAQLSPDAAGRTWP